MLTLAMTMVRRMMLVVLVAMRMMQTLLMEVVTPEVIVVVTAMRKMWPYLL